MSFIPRPHEIYRHFKGNLYQIVAVAQHSETDEQLVVYQALYGDFKIYARPLDMFTSRVDKVKYPEAKQEFRFELQGPIGEGGSDRMSQPAGRPEAAQENRKLESVAQEAGKLKTAAQEIRRPESVAQEAGKPKTAAPEIRRPESAAQEAGKPEATAQEQASAAKEPDSETEELNLDPLVIEFLDADSYSQRLNILAGLHHRITDDMITVMALSCDIEVGEGDTEVRYISLRNCLTTLEKYECDRPRRLEQ